MKIFKDRKSAGKLLAKRLQGYRGVQGTIVLGIPRGGVVVAAEIAKQLQLPFDIIVTRKIGHPNQPELALGAVDPDGEVVWDQDIVREFGEVRETVRNEIEEIKRREREYRHARPGLARLMKGKRVILVDDGIATGATTLAAVKYLKRHNAEKVILAVPVASREAVDRIVRELGEFGEVIVLETPQYFRAVGQFYQNFEEVSDEEVIQYLRNGR